VHRVGDKNTAHEYVGHILPTPGSASLVITCCIW
jgi:hypothetical protein